MTDKNLTHLYFLLDRSGSMESIREDIVGGFTAFIAEQSKEPGDCRVSLAQFDDEYEEVYAHRPIATVPPLVLQPRGTTAMLDAIGRLITSAGQRLAELPEEKRPGTVIVGIMTDGLENASREFPRAKIREMIDIQTNTYGWAFMYMGANQDAVEVGADIGIDPRLAVTYAPQAAGSVMAATSANIAGMRRARAAGAAPLQAMEALYYSRAQRDESLGVEPGQGSGGGDDGGRQPGPSGPTRRRRPPRITPRQS
jgi:hypothetical protein